MTRRHFAAADLTARTVTEDDASALKDFRCSTGTPWEQEVEDEIRLRIARRYLDNTGRVDDPRMVVACDATGRILGVTTHRVETVSAKEDRELVELRSTYLEVIAVSLHARRSVVELNDEGAPISFGEFMFELATNDARSRPNRIPLIFGRIDRRHKISLAFCDRVGLTTEHNDRSRQYVQRWGDL